MSLWLTLFLLNIKSGKIYVLLKSWMCSTMSIHGGMYVRNARSTRGSRYKWVPNSKARNLGVRRYIFRTGLLYRVRDTEDKCVISVQRTIICSFAFAHVCTILAMCWPTIWRCMFNEKIAGVLYVLYGNSCLESWCTYVHRTV